MKRRKQINSLLTFLTSKPVFALLAIALSAMLILSMPIISAVLKGEMFKAPKKRTTELVLKKLDLEKPKPKPKKEKRRPERSKPNHRNVKSGPRFAMNLDVAGSGGANVSMDLVSKTRGGGANKSGEVDSKPQALGELTIEVPAAITELEINALVIITFCVDISGRAYEIRVLEEEPLGKGLGQNGIRAIQQGAFAPAKISNEAVPYCGMEKEFEFRFSE